MKEPYSEGLANHTGPESCVGVCEDVGEALTGVRAGQVSSCEISRLGTPTLSVYAEGNTSGGATSESPEGLAQSKTLSMHGNSAHGNREIPEVPALEVGAGRPEKAECRKSGMDASGKSDGCVVPKKPSNKGEEPAETVEGRRPTERNTVQSATPRTQCRDGVSIGLQGVREAARKQERVRFNALLHHVTVERLRESFYALKRQASPGVDGVTWSEYEDGLNGRLADLHERIHGGTYRARPSKRTYIPKGDGKMRPLGIAALEDKIAQQAVATVLNAIYEEDFLGFSYGFRPGRGPHHALDALYVGIVEKKINWVLDADIRSFFDTIDHGWLMKFIEHRIADPRILRLIRKWLRAGVSEQGVWSRTEVGTPQGAVISPLLANIYLHYVLDVWAHQWRKTKARGDMIIVRFADDFVLGFQYPEEAEQFRRELSDRMAKFGLALHDEKTRLIEFGRFAAERRQKRGLGKPETFDFLGFTHICATTRKDKRFTIKRKTVARRLRRKLKEVKEELHRRMHQSISEMGKWLRSVVQGFMNYYAVPGNFASIEAFRTQVSRHWLRVLRQRSQKHRLTWGWFSTQVNRWLPKGRILHRYPGDRFHAIHSK
jgi:RNA-directed DNA polymerase